tara:strand:- start:373 stop:756 length:384 start_codon:yes stop_codon:yes gene_type:complete
MKSKLLAMLGVASLLVSIPSGCVFLFAGAAGAGTVAYVGGDLEITSEKSVDEVYAAVEATCKELEFDIFEHEKKEFTGMVMAMSDFGKVTIRVKGKSPEETHVSVRVGTFGDKGASKLIMDKLKPKI